MVITREQLIDKGATRDLIEWFADEFGEETELEELKKKLGGPDDNEFPDSHWLHWLFEKFELSGVFEYRHPGGELWILCHYKAGKENGVYEVWYANGQLRVRWHYKDSCREGLSEEWDIDGKLVEECTYKDGQVVK